MRDFLEFLAVCFAFVLGVIVFVVVLASPFAYIEGTAKSEYLLQQKGVDIPWYKAVFLPDTVYLDAKVSITENK